MPKSTTGLIGGSSLAGQANGRPYREDKIYVFYLHIKKS